MKLEDIAKEKWDVDDDDNQVSRHSREGRAVLMAAPEMLALILEDVAMREACDGDVEWIMGNSNRIDAFTTKRDALIARLRAEVEG